MQGFIKTMLTGSCLMYFTYKISAGVAGVAGVFCNMKKIKETQFSDIFL
jgi:hypothetical protein